MTNIDREQLATLSSTNFVRVGDWVNITDIDMYGKLARGTAQNNIVNDLNYFGLGLAGEAGEVANKIKKVIRDNNGELTDKAKQEIGKECGGVFWYLVGVCRLMGKNPSEVMAENINILHSRKERGVIGGSGDNR